MKNVRYTNDNIGSWPEKIDLAKSRLVRVVDLKHELRDKRVKETWNSTKDEMLATVKGWYVCISFTCLRCLTKGVWKEKKNYIQKNFTIVGM